MVSSACTPGESPDAPGIYRPEGYEPGNSVGYLMRRVLVSLAGEIERALEPSGLTNAQWVPLFKLMQGEASTVAELARECQLDTGAMTRMLDRLEAKGLLRRTRSQSDRRVVNLALTPEGEVAARGIPAVLCRVQNAHLQGFDSAEWEQLTRLLQRMLVNGARIQAAREGKADGG